MKPYGIFFLVTSFLLPLSASFQSQAATAGQDYQIVSPSQPVDDPRKVEVLEIFSYACPHCASLASMIEPWSHKLPAGVVYHRIPVTFGHPQWAVLARAYYALESLKAADRLQEKVFKAIHEDHINLMSEDELFDWVAKEGVDRDKFRALYGSFGVESRVRQGEQKAMSFGIDGVPTVVVDGKYLTSPSQAGSNAALFPVLNQLIDEEMSAKHLK